MRILNIDEILEAYDAEYADGDIVAIAQAQHQADLKAFTELLDNRNLVPQRVADDIKLYLVESFKQMVELEEGNDEEVIKEFMDEGYTREQAIKNLASIDRGMTDAKAGRVSKIDMSHL